MKSLLKVETWVYGLVSGFIGGGASALATLTGDSLARSAGMDVHTPNLKELGIMFLSAGIASAMAYLKQSPLPPLVTTETTTIIKETNEKINP